MNNTPNNEIPLVRYEEFLQLFINHQSKIFGYIITMVPCRSIAEDILQDTLLVMWRKFSDFTPGTNFSAWGVKIARLNILKYYERERNSHIKFNSDAVENISECLSDSKNYDNSENSEIKALRNCMKKLTEVDQNMITFRYMRKYTIKEIGIHFGRSAHGIYKTMARIHNLLQKCVEREVSIIRK